jgi:O-antigen ligase/tetratricopeptide (TPR) repeat protein
MTSPASLTDNAADTQADALPKASLFQIARESAPVSILTLMMFLVPAVGVPNELILQDTLKSAIVAHGVLIAALVFFWQQRKRSEPLLWHGMVWLPIVLMLYAIGSMVWSHTYLAGVEAIRWFILGLLMWLGLNTLTRSNIPMLMWGIHAGAVVASLWAALQFWFGWSLFPQFAQPASTFINRNFFAEYLVCTLPISVYMLTRLQQSQWLGLMALSVALNVVALMMTGTRSALLALFVITALWVFTLARYRKLFACFVWSRRSQTFVSMLLLACVVGLGSIPTENSAILQEARGATAIDRSLSRMVSMTDSREYTERSFSMRATMWMATARMMIANPWVGVGAGAWEVQIPLYQRVDSVLETDYYAHNEFLQLLSEYGAVVGGLLLAVLIAYQLHAAGITWGLKGDDEEEAPVRVVALMSLAALMLVSNAGFPWHLASTGMLFMLALGILAATDVQLARNKSRPDHAVKLHHRHAMAATVMLLGCACLATYITWQAVQAEKKIVHALHLGTFLGQELPAQAKPEVDRKLEMLQSLREGIAINPHYRKFAAVAAEQLSAAGDFTNAIWVLETVVASRPYVAALWSGLALNYAQSGNKGKAWDVFRNVERLKPDTLDTLTLKVTLLGIDGQRDEATKLLSEAFNAGRYDFALLQTGYAIGLKFNDRSLAVRSLELFNQNWPQHAADTYFRLGSIYSEALPPEEGQALDAFKQGLAAVPTEEREKYVRQVPSRYRSQM